MSRIVCKLNYYTWGGCVYQRKQYKKARYRKREEREWKRMNNELNKMFNMIKP